MKQRIELNYSTDRAKDDGKEHFLAAQNELFKDLIKNIPGILYVINKDGKLVWWNNQVETATCYTPRELFYLPVTRFFHPAEQAKVKSAIKRAFREGVTEMQSYLLTKDARKIPLNFKASVTQVQGIKYLIGVGMEVESLKIAQEESFQKWKLIQTFADQSDTIIFIKDLEGKYVLVNRKFRILTKLENHQVIGQTDLEVFGEPTAKRFRKYDIEVISKQEPRELEECFDTPQGRRYFLIKKFPLHDVSGIDQGICGIAQDITHLKQSELRARVQQEAITYLATNQDLDEADLDTKLKTLAKICAETLDVNRVNIWLLNDNTLRCICSYESGSLNAMKDEILNVHEFPHYYGEIKNSRVLPINDARNDPRSRELSENYLKPNNVYSLLDASVNMAGSVTAIVCNEATGEIREWLQDEINFAGAVADQVGRMLAIEDRKVKEKELHESLKEKEVLLAEIHHRVKNNLAVISSLVQLQALEEENEEVSHKLLKSVVRIKSMATIHEQMYQSQNFSRMDFAVNIKKLVSSIFEIHQPATDIEFNFELQPIQLCLNQAVPCSLIINEVITNILKHAFIDKTKNIVKSKGKISFELLQVDESITLIIKDDGFGFSEDIAFQKPDSLGIVLIDVLCKQLEADYHYGSKGQGSQFVLKFKNSKVGGITRTYS